MHGQVHKNMHWLTDLCKRVCAAAKNMFGTNISRESGMAEKTEQMGSQLNCLHPSSGNSSSPFPAPHVLLFFFCSPDTKTSCKYRTAKKMILAELDSSVQSISPTESLPQNVLKLDTMQENPLLSDISRQSTSLNGTSMQSISQLPALLPCKETELDQYPQLISLQLTSPCHQTDTPDSNKAEYIVLNDKKETVKSLNSSHESTMCPLDDFSLQPIEFMSPVIKKNDSWQKSPQMPNTSPIMKPSGTNESPGDVQICNRQTNLNSNLMHTEVLERKPEEVTSRENRIQLEDSLDLIKPDIPTTLTETRVTTSPFFLQELNSIQPSNEMLLQENTFHFEVDIFQLAKKEIPQEGCSSQLDKLDSPLQKQDINILASVSHVQDNNSQLKEHNVELHENIAQMMLHNASLPEPHLSSEHSTSPLMGKDLPLKESALQLQEQGNVLEMKKSLCDKDGQLSGETTQSSIALKFLVKHNSLQPDSVCLVDSQAFELTNLQAQSLNSVVHGQDMAGAGLEVPDSQLLGVLDENFNDSDQVFNDIITTTPTSSESNQKNNMQPPKPMPHVKCLSSKPSRGEDASNIVQGLITELSDLNRLIMTTHRDLRQKRGKIPPARGTITGRKKRREI
ncbi:break repair meiotic recombinase recruitment factor 1 [Pelobates fuscus]|uniref:break repair meiotic recombinase recruitment factor 1 n=1 Tax=Pelobates fuscus TaxID=191477 RepID=UPI002FE48108